jgi:hypothetical protein
MLNLQNDKKQIEDFGISKYQNKNLQSSQEKKHILHFLACETSHKKLKTLELRNTKTKDL